MRQLRQPRSPCASTGHSPAPWRYSLTDQIDWDIGSEEKRGTVNACGPYDLDRKPRPVAAAYRELLGAYGQISSVANAEMFALTDQPARLKVHV